MRTHGQESGDVHCCAGSYWVTLAVPFPFRVNTGSLSFIGDKASTQMRPVSPNTSPTPYFSHNIWFCLNWAFWAYPRAFTLPSLLFGKPLRLHLSLVALVSTASSVNNGLFISPLPPSHPGYLLAYHLWFLIEYKPRRQGPCLLHTPPEPRA